MKAILLGKCSAIRLALGSFYIHVTFSYDKILVEFLTTLQQLHPLRKGSDGTGIIIMFYPFELMIRVRG